MIERAANHQTIAVTPDAPSELEIAALCMALAQNPELDLSCKDGVRMWLDSLGDAQGLSELRHRLGLEQSITV